MKEKYMSVIRRMFASLSVRNYRLFFTGNLMSHCGGWIQAVAFGWVSLQLTHSGTQLGLVEAMLFVPVLIAGPWGGLIADRFPKRNILFFTQSAFGVLTFSVSVLIWTDTMTLASLYIFAALCGIVRVFDGPACATLSPELVGIDQVKNAVSLNGAVYNFARIVGPAIAGMLIAVSGPAICFFINSLSFGVFVLMLALMRSHEFHRMHHAGKGTGHIRAGLRYVLATPRLRTTLLVAALMGTFLYEFTVTVPLFVERVLHGDAATLGALWSAMGIGALVGALYSAAQHELTERSLARLVFFFGISVIACALVSGMPAILIGMCIIGFCSSNFMAGLMTVIQLESVPEMRGRVVALRGMAILGSTAIGAPIIGFICEHAGVRYGLIVGGLAALISGVLLMRSANSREK